MLHLLSPNGSQNVVSSITVLFTPFAPNSNRVQEPLRPVAGRRAMLFERSAFFGARKREAFLNRTDTGMGPNRGPNCGPKCCTGQR